MNYILFTFIFFIILFLYLHIFHHLKISKDLEVYSIVNPTKNELEEICDVRQPVVFTLEEPILTDINIEYVQKNYGAFDINIQNYEREDKNINYMENVPFIFNEAIEFLKLDADITNKGFISNKNKDFLEETTIIKKFKQNDYFLRPPLVSSCEYDLLFGCKNSITKLQYNLNYRNFFLCLDGSITIRVVSPTYKKYMDHKNNYLDFEFYSPINVWNIQDQYKNSFDKIKTMDIVLKKGDVVYIPAYWYYSIHFTELSTIASFNYRTYMNSIAISPELCIYFLQNQNVKRQTHRKYYNTVDEKQNTQNDEIEITQNDEIENTQNDEITRQIIEDKHIVQS